MQPAIHTLCAGISETTAQAVNEVLDLMAGAILPTDENQRVTSEFVVGVANGWVSATPGSA